MPSQRLLPSEFPGVLRCLLAGGDGSAAAPAEHVRAFLRFAEDCGGEVRAWGINREAERIAALGALLLPGRVAMILAPGAWPGLESAAQDELGTAALAELSAFGQHYAQALVEGDGHSRRRRVERLGFARLTELIYLERAALYPWVDPPRGRFEWRSYSSSAHALFAEVLTRSYIDSRDCPELNGLRPIDDVIASHKAAGAFCPELWEVGLVDGIPVGCILLGRPARKTVEIAYLGVDADRRGAGLGADLLRRAIELAREAGAEQLTLAVDERNGAARRLYARFGMRELTRRTAYLRKLASASGTRDG